MSGLLECPECGDWYSPYQSCEYCLEQYRHDERMKEKYEDENE